MPFSFWYISQKKIIKRTSLDILTQSDLLRKKESKERREVSEKARAEDDGRTDGRTQHRRPSPPPEAAEASRSSGSPELSVLDPPLNKVNLYKFGKWNVSFKKGFQK